MLIDKSSNTKKKKLNTQTNTIKGNVGSIEIEKKEDNEFIDNNLDIKHEDEKKKSNKKLIYTSFEYPFIKRTIFEPSILNDFSLYENRNSFNQVIL